MLSGEGTATVGQETRTDQTGRRDPDSRRRDSEAFETTGTVPLELMAVGIARDMNKKHDMLATPPQRLGGPGGRGR